MSAFTTLENNMTEAFSLKMLVEYFMIWWMYKCRWIYATK